jgi:hypothetical protein
MNVIVGEPVVVAVVACSGPSAPTWLWMNRASPPGDVSSSGMGTLRLDATGVSARAQRVLDGADALEEMRWPAMSSADLSGSAVERACTGSCLEDRLADVVTRMRTWAAAARAAAVAVERADLYQGARLGTPR